ncbi:FecR family protein [bacterium A37T11]|nr:FecR family protein [bacterium A37T11]
MARKKSLTILFARIILKKAKNEEKQQFNNWYEYLDISEGQHFNNEADEKNVKEKLLQKIHDHMEDMDSKKEHLYRSSWWRASAAALLFAALSAILYISHYQSKFDNPAYISIRADNKLKRVKMTDGTIITLNMRSQIRWKTDFNKKERRVELTGEALFQVKHDDRKPFIVLTDSIETFDLGTTFNIENYPNEAEIKVSLIEGSVSINKPHPHGPTVYIKPGQMLAYNRIASYMQVKPIATENITDWTKGLLVFNGVPLPEALERLALHYNLKIRYPQKGLDSSTVTGSFRNEQWQDALKAILFTFNMNYSVRKEVIYIY